MESNGNHKGKDASMCSESEGYIADDETRPGSTAMQRLKERVGDYENHMKGMESSDKENSHPEPAYSTPIPHEEKPGFFSRMGHKFGYEKEDTTALTKGVELAPEVQAADKGVGSSELGTGYEADGEETVNPAIVPKYDGVKLPFEMQGGYKSVGISEVGTGYEEGSDGSFSHSYPRHIRSIE